MRHHRLAARAAALLIVVLVALPLLEESRAPAPGAVFALDADQARALCQGSGYPEADFLERARTMGVAGLLLRPEAGQGAADRGLSQGSAASTDQGAAAARFDPDRVRALAAKGFVPVPWIENGLQLATFKGLRLPSIYLLSASYRNPLKGNLEALREALDDGRSLAAFPNAAPEPEGGALGLGSMDSGTRATFADGAGGPADWPLTAGEMDADDGVAAARREVLGRGDRLVVLRLDLRRDVEENLADVRRILRRLRDDGLSLEPPVPAGGRAPGPVETAARRILALVLCVLGPIFALRCGVQVLHSESGSRRLPEASPFREMLLAAAATAGAAAFVGLAAYSASARAAWRSAGPWPGWAAGSATLILSALGLYLPETASSRGSPWKAAAPAAAWTLAALVLLLLGGRWEGLGARERLMALSAAKPGLWWLADRWREALVGYPCLFVGLCLLLRRLETGDGLGGSGPGDPRPWLLLAMFAPMGAVASLASAWTPFGTALGQTAAGGAIGLALGGGLYAAKCHAPDLVPVLAGMIWRKRGNPVV